MKLSASYCIDQNDNLCNFGESWDAFAFANASHDMTGGLLEGRSLWDFIANRETRKIYQTLYTRVRDTGAPSEINFRCDSPVLKRNMELVIEPWGDYLLHTSRLVSETPRPLNHLFTQAITQDPHDAYLIMCSWCKRVKLDEAWFDSDIAMKQLEAARMAIPDISHGMCEDCFARHDPV